ncbi:MAG: DUF1015 domain-containing protein [Christensenellaceae bacterium]|jgi:hypothetical protein|nr:DUF1015 domain-containing protein [Christensenellaceae bacterium]
MLSFIQKPKILLPKAIPLEKWATVACDQFTSEPKYWEELRSYIGDSLSTIDFMLPEIDLKGDNSSNVERIRRSNEQFKKSDFNEINSYVLVERAFNTGERRTGIMVSVDLSAYSYEGDKVFIRSSEATVPERLPVRVDIRKVSKIELPHTLLLLDDANQTVIEPVAAYKQSFEKVYDFELNMGGGRITGYKIPDYFNIDKKIYALLNEELQVSKYGEYAGIALAVGDGNHSIASAYKLWDESGRPENSPLRYFLCEIVNLYEGAEFEPIHRYIENPTAEFLQKLQKLSNETVAPGETGAFVKTIENNSLHYFGSTLDKARVYQVVQSFLDSEKENGLKVDYVHSETHLSAIVADKGGLGISMPSFPKSALFPFIIRGENLPKKSFSIGQPEQKRYYLEARCINE